MRAFLALPVQYEQGFEPLSSLVENNPGITPVRRHQLHITLFFFRAISPKDVERMVKAITKQQEDKALHRVILKEPQVRLIPKQMPRIISLVFAKEQQLQTNYQKLYQTLQSIRLPGLDKRPYKPHLTVARLRRALTSQELEQCSAMQVNAKLVLDRLVLYKSQLTPQGPEHTVLEEWKLF
ncbi:MAG: RNA 2',3'-cyclic phosphodiesterase [Candidatus Woesearchaeota archaeon]